MVLDDTAQARLKRFAAQYFSSFSVRIEPNLFDSDDNYASAVLKLAYTSANTTLRLLAVRVDFDRAIHSREKTFTLDISSFDLVEEKREVSTMLSSDEIVAVAEMQSVLESVFGGRLDIARFARDDAYGRAILRIAFYSGISDLASLARRFLDDEGRPTRHRRNCPSQKQRAK